MWEYIPFENCLEKTKIKFKLPKKDYKESGKYPVVSQEESLISGYHDNISYIFKVTKPIVVFGDHTLALKYIDFDFIVGADGVKILQPVEEINTKYFYYVLKALVPKTTGYARHYKLLKKLDIPVPPLPEQERIVAKLDAAFAKIDEVVQLLNERYNNTSSLIATAQNALFEDMPLSIPRLKLSEAAKFENGDRGKNYPSKKYQLSEGIPFVNAGDFSLDGDITRDGMAYISEERFDLLGAGKFQKEDILFCLRGSLGKSAINKTLKRGAIASSLVIIRALQDIYPDYLFAFIRSDIVKRYISETAGGTAQPNLSAKVVMGYEIPVPSLQEQEAIADKFWALRLQGLKVNSLIKKKKLEFMVLKSAILKQELQPSEAA
jgi:type I restriction enzyme S subunit